MNRNDFPILKKIIYLDSAASALKPLPVIEAMNNFYLNYPISPHSPNSLLGQKILAKIKECRKNVAKLIEGDETNIIFTSGTTDSLNKIAFSLMNNFHQNDEILISSYNHISNVMPWIKIAELKNYKIKISSNIFDDINEKTKIIALSQKNNSLNIDYDFDKLYKICQAKKIILVNDAAQAIVETKVSLKKADVIVFSGNKIFGPTGIGVLAIKKDLLNKTKSFILGGNTINKIVNANEYYLKEGLKGFEAGSPNMAGIIGLNIAINYFNQNKDINYLKKLACYAYDEIKKVKNIILYSTRGEKNIIFNIKGFDGQDVVSYLGHQNIYLRSGDHCAKMIKNFKKNFDSSIRLSLSFYNNKQDINKAIEAIKNGGDFLGFI